MSGDHEAGNEAGAAAQGHETAHTPPIGGAGFSVYVVESPSAADFYLGRSEGELIKQVVELNQMPCTHRYAVTREMFQTALTDGWERHQALHPDTLTILHLSAHGNEHCIGFTNGEEVPWAELRDYLRPLNVKLGGWLLVCMSSCRGYSGTRMAMHLDDNDYPFVAIVGSSETPEWGETAIGFGTFYHHLKRGATVSAAVDRMIAASGHNDFLFEFSAASRQGYADFLAEKQRGQLEANAVNSLVGSQYPVTPPSTTPTSWIGETAVAEPLQGPAGLAGLIPR